MTAITNDIKEVWKRDRKLFLLIIFIFLLVLSCQAKVGFNYSDSVHFTFYTAEKYKGRTISPGEYIRFVYENPNVSIVSKGLPLCKKVACGPGQTIEVSDKAYLCDGVKIAEETAFYTQKYGLITTNTIHKQVLPEHKYFVIGERANSYDSRFFGVIDEAQISHIVHPLF